VPKRRCCGKIEEIPVCQKFIPLTHNNDPVITLRLEELEAIRLKDVKGLEQADCAATMGLSRPTFQRILYAARTKVATTLVEGRTIVIEGGSYVVKNRVFECTKCKNVWEVEPCTAGGKHGYEIACPKCGSMEKSKLENGIKHACGGGHQHGNSNGHGLGCCGGHQEG
jgi:uncharacterized protein